MNKEDDLLNEIIKCSDEIKFLIKNIDETASGRGCCVSLEECIKLNGCMMISYGFKICGTFNERCEDIEDMKIFKSEYHPDLSDEYFLYRCILKILRLLDVRMNHVSSTCDKNNEFNKGIIIGYATAILNIRSHIRKWEDYEKWKLPQDFTKYFNGTLEEKIDETM